MTPFVLAFLAAAAVALLAYVWRERLGASGAGLIALRTIGLGALILLVLDPQRTIRRPGAPPTVLLDASLSMGAAGGQWSAAYDSAVSLAGPEGTVLRFGGGVALADSNPPEFGASHLNDALRASVGSGAPVVVVTDGELDDVSAIPPGLLGDVGFVVLPRRPVPDAALLDVHVPERVAREDTIAVDVTIGSFAGLAATTGRLSISLGERRLVEGPVDVPAAPGTGRRTLRIPGSLLRDGANVLRFELVVGGDLEPGDNVRYRVTLASDQPSVVFVSGGADWESRFMVAELAGVTRSAVRGFARVAPDIWVDMSTQRRSSWPDVQRLMRGARVVVARGDVPLPAGVRAVWHWPAGGADTEVFGGDWYVAPSPASPVAGMLAGTLWDSLPPLTGVVPIAAGERDWVALSARLGRRGVERPVLVGGDSAGARRLTTAGQGLWRWALRGGTSREAYRTFLAAGVDWLLSAPTRDRDAALSAVPVTERGRPVEFAWHGDSIPDSLAVSLGGASASAAVLRFDANGTARIALEPGVYSWVAPTLDGVAGTLVVEPYSREIPPRAAVAIAADAGDGSRLALEHLRGRWWMYLLVVAAFAGEWTLRQRRGLP